MTALRDRLLPLTLTDVPQSLASLLEQEGVPLRIDARNGPSTRFVLFDSLRTHRPQIDAEQIAIDVNDVRKQLGYDPFQLLEASVTCRSVWRVGAWEAKEETAVVDRSAMRVSVLGQLRKQIEFHDGVWIRIGAMPAPYRTAFCFRFDHDVYDAADFAAVLDAIRGYEQMTTHFVCASTHQTQSKALARLQGCDVGSHGFHHHTYRSVDDNLNNIRQGIDALQSLGLRPSGFAAPHGRYHANLAEAIARCGISHSSEFAVAYDDLPFFAATGDAIQIPIHPVCLGIVLEAVEQNAPGDHEAKRRAAEEVEEYFLDVSARKRANRDPIFLYGHPDGRLGCYPHILRNLLAEVAGWDDVWRTNFTAFQTWWRARRATVIEVDRREAGCEVRVQRPHHGHQIVLEWVSDDGVAGLTIDQPSAQFNRESMTFERRPTIAVSQPLRREPIRGLKERLRRALDWEYATPIAEINTGQWRGKIKRTLRRWKESAR